MQTCTLLGTLYGQELIKGADVPTLESAWSFTLGVVPLFRLFSVTRIVSYVKDSRRYEKSSRNALMLSSVIGWTY